ncbi:hypothetical protein Sjap_024191 [Stephania japonica]|uniref:Uncharacterized protein n=1 Tax=Stephania japonica TaxID=461633 RepID=A0AAP0ELL8_9MAGN
MVRDTSPSLAPPPQPPSAKSGRGNLRCVIVHKACGEICAFVFVHRLAAMSGLITLALLVLAACLQQSSSSSSSDEVEKPGEEEVPQGEVEPKIVVIMPGDDRPTYIGKPVCPSQITR